MPDTEDRQRALVRMPRATGHLAAPRTTRRSARTALSLLPLRWMLAPLLVLAGCATPLEPARPPLPQARGYAASPLPSQTASAPGAGGAAQALVADADVRADWWTLFRSPALDTLVARALAGNPGLESAEASLRSAQALLAAQTAAFAPTAQAGVAGTRTKLAANAGNTGPGGALSYSYHTGQLSVGYTPDLFGGTRAQVLGAQAQAEVQRLQWQAARVTLVTNLVGAAVQDAALRRQIELTTQTVNEGERLLALLQRQWRAGQVSRLEVAVQEFALAQARQQLPPLRRQLEVNRDLMRALAGDGPDHALPDFDLDALTLPSELPLSLPAALLEQRPDVRIAWEQVRAAAGGVGVARANRLPSLSITADAGGGASSPGQLLRASGLFFDLAARLTQTLFDAGALARREQAAQETLRASAASYQASVIAAWQNVADCLQVLHADATGLRLATEAADAARIALDLTRRQQGAGYLDGLALGAAQLADLQARQAVAQARAARLADTAALYQALGGGWWHVPDPVAAR
jgi:NodT family efflux transporter outer membrane factor (OMF) lipoprotein